MVTWWIWLSIFTAFSLAFIILPCFCSCWYFPVEGQKGYCWCDWGCHCNLGAFRITWISLAHTCVPYPDSCSGSSVLVVKCIHLHQQVSLMICCNSSFFDTLWPVSHILLLHLRSPPKIPEVIIPEDIIVGVASAFRVEINTALAVLREIASGRDLKKFLAVCPSSIFLISIRPLNGELNF